MKGKKLILLFAALLLPSVIFIFLRTFGKNEFQVPALFTDEVPASAECASIKYPLPYTLEDTVLNKLITGDDSVVVVFFKSAKSRENALGRPREQYKGTPVSYLELKAEENMFLKQCIFLLAEPFDIALVDRRGAIRGQYNSQKRDEIDRVITELAILMKKY